MDCNVSCVNPLVMAATFVWDTRCDLSVGQPMAIICIMGIC